MDETEYVRDQVRYALTHYLFRHPVVWGAGVLFLVSLGFLALGTIKVQSLAIDINQQGREALDRALININQVSSSAESSIALAEKASLNRIQAEETKAKTAFAKAIEPVLDQGVKSVRDEAKNAVSKIKSEGADAVDARVRELQTQISDLRRQLDELRPIQDQLNKEVPLFKGLLADWQNVQTKGESWRASLKLAEQHWHFLALVSLACIIIAFVVSFFVARWVNRRP